jgi:hypothetical protein
MLAAPKINILARNIKTIALKRFIDAIRAPGAYQKLLLLIWERKPRSGRKL